MSACADALRLLAVYRTALAAYDRIRGAAFQSLAPEHITFKEAAQAQADAQTALLRARRAYWRHVDEHACRRMQTVRASSSLTAVCAATTAP